MPTLGPSFPGFPMGPRIPGSPCGQRSVHLRPQNTCSKTKKRAMREEQRITFCHFFFWTAPRLISAISVLAPFLLAGRLNHVLQGAPSLPSALAGLGLWSGTSCRHSAKRRWGKWRTGKRRRRRKKRFHQAEVQHCLPTPYYVTSPGWRTRPRPT